MAEINYKKVTEKERDIADTISDIVNGLPGSPTRIGWALARMTHPTLSQIFMRIVCGFIHAMAYEHSQGYTDGRNKATGKLCLKIDEALMHEDVDISDVYLPLI